MKTVKLMQLYSDRNGAELLAAFAGQLRQQIAGKSVDTAWNAELFRSPKLRQMAAREAAGSDFVFIAAEEGRSLSPEITQWLDLWKNRARRKRATLIALLHREGAASPRVVECRLLKFARAAELDFFCHSKVERSGQRADKRIHALFQ